MFLYALLCFSSYSFFLLQETTLFHHDTWLGILKQVVHAFTVLAANDITHNDVKADNILLKVSNGECGVPYPSISHQGCRFKLETLLFGDNKTLTMWTILQLYWLSMITLKIRLSLLVLINQVVSNGADLGLDQPSYLG